MLTLLALTGRRVRWKVVLHHTIRAIVGTIASVRIIDAAAISQWAGTVWEVLPMIKSVCCSNTERFSYCVRIHCPSLRIMTRCHLGLEILIMKLFFFGNEFVVAMEEAEAAIPAAWIVFIWVPSLCIA